MITEAAVGMLDWRLPPSSRGPGRHPFKVETGVRIPLGAPIRAFSARCVVPIAPVLQRVTLHWGAD
jgi:hypothetical protein